MEKGLTELNRWYPHIVIHVYIYIMCMYIFIYIYYCKTTVIDRFPPAPSKHGYVVSLRGPRRARVRRIKRWEQRRHSLHAAYIRRCSTHKARTACGTLPTMTRSAYRQTNKQTRQPVVPASRQHNAARVTSNTKNKAQGQTQLKK